MLGLIIVRTKHDSLTNFLKIKTPTFVGFKIETMFKVIVNYYERLHRYGIVE